MIGRVSTLSGTAMPANATTGTQIRLRIATSTPTVSAPSQLIQPKREFALLVAGEQARARQEAAPVLLDDLEAARRPAVALLLVGLEGVGQQAVAVAAVGVMGVPALLQDGEAEIGVLADGVARPAAGLFEGGAADQAHGAVHDDGVGLVALDHADVEEAGIFAVHHVMQRAAVAVAVILRRLDQADLADRRRPAPGRRASRASPHNRSR